MVKRGFLTRRYWNSCFVGFSCMDSPKFSDSLRGTPNMSAKYFQFRLPGFSSLSSKKVISAITCGWLSNRLPTCISLSAQKSKILESRPKSRLCKDKVIAYQHFMPHRSKPSCRMAWGKVHIFLRILGRGINFRGKGLFVCCEKKLKRKTNEYWSTSTFRANKQWWWSQWKTNRSAMPTCKLMLSFIPFGLSLLLNVSIWELNFYKWEGDHWKH